MAWVNFNNGDGGLDIRTKLNDFLTSVNDFMSGNNKYTNIERDKVASNTDSVNSLLAPEVLKFAGLAVPPPHIEGTAYYNTTDGILKVQGPTPGIEVSVGHGMHIHVVNNTGATIEKGMACRSNGVAAGEIQIAKALADTFQNSTIFGIAQADILNGATGAVMVQGELSNLNTLGYEIGVPLYLSDTVPGTYSAVAPSIISQIGGCVIKDGANGKLIVSLINNKNLPAVIGLLNGQNSPVYSVGATPVVINSYITEDSIVIPINAAQGSITSGGIGAYSLGFTYSGTISDEEVDIIIEFYDVTHNSVLFTYTKSSGRGSNPTLVPIAESIKTVVILPSVNTEIAIRISCGANETLNLLEAQFTLTSLHV